MSKETLEGKLVKLKPRGWKDWVPVYGLYYMQDRKLHGNTYNKDLAAAAYQGLSVFAVPVFFVWALYSMLK